MNKTKAKNTIKDNELWLIVLPYILFTVIVFLVLFLYEDIDFSHNNINVSEISSVEIINDDEIAEELIAPSKVLMNSIEYTIDIKKYQNIDHLAIAGTIPSYNTKMYIDDKLIYENANDSNHIIFLSGYKSILVNIPEDITNPKIIVKSNFPLNRHKKYKINTFIIGERSDVLVYKIKDDFIILFASIVLIINFIFSFIIVVNNKDFFKIEHYSVFRLSIFGYVIAVYFLSKLWTVLYFINASEFMYFVEFITLLLLPTPVCKYIQYKVDNRFHKYFNAMYVCTYLNVSVQILLTIFNIIEFRDMLYFTYSVITTSMALIFVSIILSDKNRMKMHRTIFISILSMVVFSMVVLFYYVFFNILLIKSLGVLSAVILSILEYRELYNKYVFYKEQEHEKDVYKALSYTDSLTGLSNRKANKLFIKNIFTNRISGWILSIDINDLKYVNDNYGHLKGDELIIDFSNLLNDLQDNNPNIRTFRIGGDEFFVFVKESRAYDIENLVYELKKAYLESNTLVDIVEPSFSAGYYYYDAYDPTDIMEIYNKADRMMYEDKVAYKKAFRLKHRSKEE